MLGCDVNERKRLLLVTPRFPFPPVSGERLRIFHLIRLLQREFDVVLLAQGDPPEEDVDALRQATGVQDIRCFARTLPGSLAGALVSGLKGRPLQVGYFDCRAQAEAVVETLKEVDVAIFHLVRTSGMKPDRIDIPSVLEMCDALSANYAQTAREGALLSPWRIVSQIEASRLLEFERSETKRYDLVSLHTAKDAERIGLAPDSLLVSTQGVDLSGLNYVAPDDRQGRSIALVGKVDFFPNKQSVLWFAKHVLPALPQDMTLKVIGDCSPKLKRRLESLPRVVVTGRVASIGEACADCFAAVAPMRVATGVQNKVLEYFAMGLPSILSPSVASGLLKEAEGGYQVADVQDGTEWARLLMAVAERPASYGAQTGIARRYAFEMHSWDRIGVDYIARLRGLMSGGQSAALDN